MRHGTANDHNTDNQGSQANYADFLKKISEGAQTALTTAQDFFKNLGTLNENISALWKCISDRYSVFKEKHQYEDSTIFKAVGLAACLIFGTYMGRNEVKAGFDIAAEFGYDKASMAFNMMPESVQSYYETACSYASGFAKAYSASAEAGAEGASPTL